MAISIILYDENHERVGETYTRRAKQLIRSGRASWLEEGHSLLLVSQPSIIPSSPHTQEEPIMTESIYTNNSIAPDSAGETPHSSGKNELLMYLAQKNVAQKKNLIKNIIAYVIAWTALHAFQFASPIRGGISRSYTAVEPHVVSISNDVIEFIRPFGVHSYGLSDIIHGRVAFPLGNVSFFVTQNEAIAQPVETMIINNNPGLFIAGIMAAWGAWILARGFVVVRRHIRNKPRKPSRPDPIAAEYQRLQTAADNF